MLRVLALCCALALASAKFIIREAGSGGVDYGEVPDGFVFCPDTYAGGFNVRFEPSREVDAVLFYVNDTLVRREGVAPYYIAGDRDGTIYTFKPPTGKVTIKAVSYVGNSTVGSYSVSGMFECQPPTTFSGTTDTPAPKPTTKVTLGVWQAGVSDPMKYPLNDNFRHCPSGDITVVCYASGAKYADMLVNGQVVRRESVAPFTIAGDSSGVAAAWSPPAGKVTLGCRTDVGQAYVSGYFECAEAPELAPTRVGVDSKYCVLLPARSYVGEKPAEWSEDPDSDALIFKADDSCATCIDDPGQYVLTYRFTAPVTSTYGIVMDSEAPHVTEHNDIFIEFDCITARGRQKFDETKLSIITCNKEPLKAYQNTARRWVGAKTVDHNGHDLSTSLLQKDQTYTIKVHGRSTLFKFFGLKLFPCAEEQCESTNGHWAQYVRRCPW